MSAAERAQVMKPFSAVLLVGGQSCRMGRDKARLACAGELLIQRQLRLMRELGAQERFIAARSAKDYEEFAVPVLADVYPGQGPLAGLERALAVAGNPLVLLLAVDLPLVTATLLSEMIQTCREGRGVVPRIRGQIEPLAACYPKAAQPLVVEHLDSQQNSARRFARECVGRDLVDFLDLPDAVATQFTNWNTPEDLQAIQ